MTWLFLLRLTEEKLNRALSVADNDRCDSDRGELRI